MAGRALDPESSPPFLDGIAAGVLAEDAEPSLYVYRHEYRTPTGLDKSRTGFVGLLDLTGPGSRGVFHGSETSPGLVEHHRKALTRSGMKVGLAAALYEDSQFDVEKILEHAIRGRKPFQIFVNGERHMIWPTADRQIVGSIEEYFGGKECFLVDGLHHCRALVKQRTRARDAGEPVSDASFYPLVLFLNAFDFGTSLTGSHHLLRRLEAFDINEFVFRIDPYFDVGTYPFQNDATRRQSLGEFREDFRVHGFSEVVIGAYFRGNPQFFLFQLRPSAPRRSLVQADLPEEALLLDSTYLHHFFIGRCLLGKTPAEGAQVDYSWDLDEAVGLVDSGQYEAALFLNPPSKRRLIQVVRSGCRVPFGTVRLEPPARMGMVMHPISGSP